MAKTTDLNSADPDLKRVAKTRNLVGAPHVIFEDDAFLSWLEDAGNNTFIAAALALNAIAASEAYIQKVIETLKLKTDGDKLAGAYMNSAEFLLKTSATGAVETPEPESTAPLGKCIQPRRVDGYSRSRFCQ